MLRTTFVLFFLLSLSCDAFLTPVPTSLNAPTALAAQFTGDDAISSRREALGSVLFGALALSPLAANALDMDAFMNSQIEADQKNCDPKTDKKCIPKLSEDEALCKYGQSGNARGEACLRVRALKAKKV